MIRIFLFIYLFLFYSSIKEVRKDKIRRVRSGVTYIFHPIKNTCHAGKTCKRLCFLH